MRLATTFNNSNVLRKSTPLTDDELFRVAPSIFAQEAHESRSERYVYIPTIEVLNGLRKEGFLPFMAAQSKSRIEGKSDFTKHMLRLRHANAIQKDEAYEIILINSHDGTSSYQMLAGFFRFVCQNGMICGDNIQDIRVPHRGNITDNVIDAAYEIVEDFDLVDESIENMKSTQLLLPEQASFAKAALSLKYDEPTKAPIDPEQLLTARRWEDKFNDNNNTVWGSLNRIQENLIKGGLRGHSDNGRRTTTRAVKSIDNDIKLNKALWILADEITKLKK